MSPAHAARPGARPEPTREQVRPWRRYLADEIAEGQIYRDIAARKDGVERDVLLGLAEAERRHEQHWRALPREHAGEPPRPPRPTRPAAAPDSRRSPAASSRRSVNSSRCRLLSSATAIIPPSGVSSHSATSPGPPRARAAGG